MCNILEVTEELGICTNRFDMERELSSHIMSGNEAGLSICHFDEWEDDNFTPDTLINKKLLPVPLPVLIKAGELEVA